MPLCKCPKDRFCMVCSHDYYKLRDNANRIEQSWIEDYKKEKEKEAAINKEKAEKYDKLKQIAEKHKLECVDPFVCKDGVELGCYAAIGKLIAGEIE